MPDYVTLIGAEKVQYAASSMQSAAETMQRAASNIDGALDRHQRFLDDWLDRLQHIVESARKAQEGEKG